MTRSVSLLLAALLGACGAQSPGDVTVAPTTQMPVPASKLGTTGQMPSLPSIAVPFLSSGGFTISADGTLGSATFTQAVYDADPSQQPASFGGAGFDLSVGGVAYDATTAQSFYATMPDDSGATYLVLGALQVDQAANTAQVIYVVAKQSDLVAGADVALDGVDRIALFAAGALDADQPSVFAIATSGTLHFAASDAANAPLDATLTASFASADWTAGGDTPDGGMRGGTDGGTTVVPPAAGTYQLTFESQAYPTCDGSLTGQEAQFQAMLPGDVGLVSGSAALAPASDGITLSASTLLGGFGSPVLDLAIDPTNSVFAVQSSGLAVLAGPDGTQRAGSYLLVRVDTSQGGEASVYFSTPDRAGGCAVAFMLDVTE